VFKVILQILLAVLIFRVLGSVVGFFRGDNKRKQTFSRPNHRDSMDPPNYEKLTPYPIEDADYEELPKRE
jgi:hypothetical protein